MSVIQKQLTSTAGFRSPGFSVNSTGALIANGIDTTNGLSFNGLQALSTTTLGSTVVNSSLQTLGTLTGLTVSSSGTVSISAATITVSTTGAIAITSGTVGTINNVNIGGTTPGDATFNTLTASTNIYIGNINVKSYAAALAVALS
jgi:hypothetical protein